MKLHVSGWRRTVLERMLFDIDPNSIDKEDGYPADGCSKEIGKSVEHMSMISGAPPFIRYKFKIAVGKATMGGDYAADFYVSKDDVMAMLFDMFGDNSFNELVSEMSEWKSRQVQI